VSFLVSGHFTSCLDVQQKLQTKEDKEYTLQITDINVSIYYHGISTVPRSTSSYHQVKMRISLKYVMEGTSIVSGRGLESCGGEIKTGSSVPGILSKNIYAVKVMFFFLNLTLTYHN